MLGKRFYKNNYDDTEYAECAVWCNTNNATIVDKGDYYECVAIVIPLADVKTAKIEELKKARDNAEESPVHIELGDFDFDTKARDRINGAKDVLKGTDNKLEWTLANNKVVSVGYNELKAVTDMAAVRCNTLHLKYRDLRDLVNSCTNVSDVGKINWGVINQ